MSSYLQGQIPDSFDQVKAAKDSIWGPVSAAKSIFKSASGVASSIKERRTKKDVRQDRYAMELQDFPRRQTTLDRAVTSASNKDRERVQHLMMTVPGPTKVSKPSLVLTCPSRPTTLPPSPPRALPVRPPPKKRNYWMLASLSLIIALICTNTPLAILLHHAHCDCPKESQAPGQTITVTSWRATTSAPSATATLTETETAYSWRTNTHISVVTSTYTFVQPPETTGINIPDNESAVVIPVTPTQTRTAEKAVVRRF